MWLTCVFLVSTLQAVLWNYEFILTALLQHLSKLTRCRNNNQGRPRQCLYDSIMLVNLLWFGASLLDECLRSFYRPWYGCKDSQSLSQAHIICDQTSNLNGELRSLGAVDPVLISANINTTNKLDWMSDWHVLATVSAAFPQWKIIWHRSKFSLGHKV